MRKMFYLTWLAWAIACVVLKIMGLISWLTALSPLWMPIAVSLCAGVILIGIADVNRWMTKREDAKLPDSCENCLFKKTCDLVNATKKEGEEKEKCMGEKFGAAIVDGKCEYYSRYN